VEFISRPGYGTAMIMYRLLSVISLILLSLSTSTTYGAVAPKKPDASAAPSTTSPAQRLGSAGSWTAYTYKDKSGKVCYLVSEAQKRVPTIAKRQRSIAMVTHRPGENVANVVSFNEGYPLKEGSDVSLDIGGTKLTLFIKGDSAWARTAELDKTIVEAMAKGTQVVVKGTPQKGPPTTDSYSLSGFAQVLAMIDKACDIKR
jgi:hypothetical protein